MTYVDNLTKSPVNLFHFNGVEQLIDKNRLIRHKNKNSEENVAFDNLGYIRVSPSLWGRLGIDIGS